MEKKYIFSLQPVAEVDYLRCSQTTRRVWEVHVNARATRFVVLFAFLVGALVVPTAASAHDDGEKRIRQIESFLSADFYAVDGCVTIITSVQGYTIKDREGKASSLSVRINLFDHCLNTPVFNGTGYIEGEDLVKIQKNLKRGTVRADLTVFLPVGAGYELPLSVDLVAKKVGEPTFVRDEFVSDEFGSRCIEGVDFLASAQGTVLLGGAGVLWEGVRNLTPSQAEQSTFSQLRVRSAEEADDC